jgi:hypothetical protein
MRNNDSKGLIAQDVDDDGGGLLAGCGEFCRIGKGTGGGECYGALAMCMIGCPGPQTPSKIRIYHTLAAAPVFLAIFTIGPSATVLR